MEPVGAGRYEIVVSDRLSARFSSAFRGLEVSSRPGRTVLTGEFRDRSQLRDLLERLEDLGIELVSVDAIG